MSEPKKTSAAAERVVQAFRTWGETDEDVRPASRVIREAADAEIRPLIEALEEYIEPGCSCDACLNLQRVLTHARGDA